jgi:hypothetical protein
LKIDMLYRWFGSPREQMIERELARPAVAPYQIATDTPNAFGATARLTADSPKFRALQIALLFRY